MTIPAEQMAGRITAWARSDGTVRAMIVYGSRAQGTADEDSDLDVIIVAEPGQRDALWDLRAGDGVPLCPPRPGCSRHRPRAPGGAHLTEPAELAAPSGQRQSCTPGRSIDGPSARDGQCREARSPRRSWTSSAHQRSRRARTGR
jgi:hypothetical protein